ncbi:hypothetical protein SUGI_0563340 [Cryptomeria japonica]|nr:hypothetical protein SUGI_0563340 [Cryptomeria japonica]
MKLLTKMGYNGKGLGIGEQGMTNLVEAKQRPRYQGLVYGENGESYEAFRKANSPINTSSYSSGSEYVSSLKKKVKR